MVSDYRIVEDAAGFRRLDPIPQEVELTEFYESRYYHLLRAGSRAPDLARLQAGGPDAAREREWLGGAHYADIMAVIRPHLAGSRMLDIGCGTGDFVGYCLSQGLEAHGIEPSVDAVDAACAMGLSVAAETAEVRAAAVKSGSVRPYDLITMLCVLEHIPDPGAMLSSVRDMLTSGGVLCVKVPNDFSVLQQAARALNHADEWWVAVPDHVNYFSAESVAHLLEDHGFEVCDRLADFPMEMFILTGQDYVSDPALGPLCHERRRHIDLSLDSGKRLAMYRQMAEAGIGRNIIIVARLSQT